MTRSSRMRTRTWCGARGFRESSSGSQLISGHPACRTMQFLGQFAQAQGMASAAWPSNGRTEERWIARQPFLKCSPRNQNRDINLVLLEIGLDARVRVAPVINRQISGLFPTVGYFPVDRCASSLVIQEKLQTDLREAAIQRRHEHILCAPNCGLFHPIGRLLLRPQTAREYEVFFKQKTAYDIRHPVG